MTSAALAVLIDLACLGAVLLMTIPLILHLFTGWKIRRDKLLAYLSPSALDLYYSQLPWEASNEANNSEAFKKQFAYPYGRRHFVVPILLFVCVEIISAAPVGQSVKSWYKVAEYSYALSGVGVGALLGSFAWVVADELGRVRKRDLA